VAEYFNDYRQNWLQHVKKKLTELALQNKFFDMPHWTTTARKSKEKMVGVRNRPLGLVLEWKMMFSDIVAVGDFLAFGSNGKVILCRKVKSGTP
jgi:hypothetical protein